MAMPKIDPKLDKEAQRILAEGYALQCQADVVDADNRGKRIDTIGRLGMKTLTIVVTLGTLYLGGEQLDVTLLKADVGDLPELITLLLRLSPWWLWLAVSLTVVVLLGWLWMHKRTTDSKISKLSARNELLEKMLDPLRTSSQLAPNGSTNRRDR
jgi:hypothetical protein